MTFFGNDYLDVKGISLRNRISSLFDELAKDPTPVYSYVTRFLSSNRRSCPKSNC